MKYLSTLASAAALLIGSCALGYGADLPSATSYKDSTSASTWTGYYLGAQGGYGWDSAVAVGFPDPASIANGVVTDLKTGVRPAGLFGGLSADALWQVSGVVVGVGTDINLANIGDNSAVAGAVGPNSTMAGAVGLNSTIDWFGTLHARAGLPLGSSALVYGTAGLAYGGISTRAIGDNTALSNDTTRIGWMAGAGGELKVSPGWSVKLEWNHIDLGASSVSEVISGLATASASQQNQFDLVKLGLSYKIGSDYAHPLN